MCTEKNWKGDCIYYITPYDDECYNLNSDWANKIMSWGPDEAKNLMSVFTCSLFSSPDCQGMYVKKQYPGTPDLT